MAEVVSTGIDRPNGWRYGISPINRMPYLPHYLTGTTITIKALGKWDAGETRTFHVYWDADGLQSAPTFDHLGTISAGPLFSGLTRLGPETENTGLMTGVPAGLPLGTSGPAAVRPGFGFNAEMLVRMGRWNGQSFTGTTTAAAAPTINNRGPFIDADSTLTFNRAEWSASYIATYQNKIVMGRKSDDTVPGTIQKYVDVFEVEVTWTCDTAYTPAAIASNLTTASGFDIASLANSNNNFNSNVTIAAGNKLENWYADTATGALTEYTGAADLSALSTDGGHIVGSTGNLYSTAMLPTALTLANFGSQSPDPYWSADASGFAYLGFRNLTTASQIPVGATITCTFLCLFSFTNAATTEGKVLLPDEAVAIMRGLTDPPTPTVSAVKQYTHDTVIESIKAASDGLVRGIQWMADFGLEYTTVANNGAFAVNLHTMDDERQDRGRADEDDGNYGEAHKLHGLCLKYLRTHDADLIPQIERQVQWHIDIEQAAVTAYGTWWEGSAPYWYWVDETSGTPLPGFAGEGGDGSGGIDPALGTLQELTYVQGQVRRATSVDQMHMVLHGMYGYRYLLRNEPAITANTTLWADCLSYISRAATFEEGHFALGSRAFTNLHKICQGLAPTNVNGMTASFINTASGTTLSDPYDGQGWGLWQLTNYEFPQVGPPELVHFDPSANSTIDNFFRALVAPNTTLAGVQRYLLGQVHDFTNLDPGLHESTSNQTTWGEIDTRWYPKGWGGRGAATGNTLEYDAGRPGDHHFMTIDGGGVRDQMNGRHAQRVICTGLCALIYPDAVVRIEMSGGNRVERYLPIKDLLRYQVNAVACHLVEETTGAGRWSASGYFGGSNPKLIDSAMTGYAILALEIGYLALTGADYLDYYPVGTF